MKTFGLMTLTFAGLMVASSALSQERLGGDISLTSLFPSKTIQSVKGHSLNLTQNHQHLIFINIWDNFDPKSELFQLVSALPRSFAEKHTQVWVQPEINVTHAQLVEYQGYFPDVAPIAMDTQLTLMKGLGIWETPYHVIVSQDKVVFKGNNQELATQFGLELVTKVPAVDEQSALTSKEAMSKETKPAETMSDETMPEETKPEKEQPEVASKSEERTYQKVEIGQSAPRFNKPTLTGGSINLSHLLEGKEAKPVSLVFLDALCPMPHFPNCESKLQNLVQHMENNKGSHWVGVMSPFYVDEAIAKDFVKRMDLTMPVIFDHGNELFRSYGVYATPYQIDIGRHGKLLTRKDVGNEKGATKE